VPARAIQEVLADHTRQWMGTAGVVGTAIGEFDGQPCMKVFVARRTEELVAKFPSSVEGYPVVLEETGEFRAL